jgi:hypothetical protein
MGVDQDDGKRNYIKAAFQWQYNLIAMGGAVAFAIVSVSALPLVLAAGVELVYLSTVPNNRRFQRLVNSWNYEKEKQEREVGLNHMFQELPPEMRLRYAKIDGICRDIRESYKRLSSTSQMFVDQMEAKLDGLSQSYVRLLNSAFHHREYLKSTNPNSIQSELDFLAKGMDRQAAKVQDINRKRIDILKKRLEKFHKIQENCEVIDAQCAAIEDVLQLIRDQSLTMRDPQQISDHLDSLVKDVEQTEETVREVESIFDLSPLADPGFEVGGAGGGRVRN